MKFKLKAPFRPAGGQAEAIKKLAAGYGKYPMQTLLGITGSGKTYVMASIIEKLQKPTLVIAHNKTLAAQLYSELKDMFPENRVEYFISYYDYYQPESYIPTTDTYIEKDSAINEEIEKMRLKAVSSLLSRNDVIVVASISCIYGISDPKDFQSMSIELKKGEKLERRDIISRLLDIQYERNDHALEPGKFRVRGDVIDVIPAYESSIIRIELSGGRIEDIAELHSITGAKITALDGIRIYPAKQFVVPEEKIKTAIDRIKQELKEHLPSMPALEASRLSQRVKYDIEMLQEVGYCSGIENYSRMFDGRPKGKPPFVLLDYFPPGSIIFIDESHQTIPQAHSMYNGDYARKKNLVDFGFRLPCAFDNRPLKFEEFEKYLRHAVFVSATPSHYEMEKSGRVVELIIRPTGLLDPEVILKPKKDQIDDMIEEIKRVVKRKERVLVTTLTKRMAEDLADYLSQKSVRVRYMHSEIESLDRIELIRQFRQGDFDVLVGINLLREGLDLPEVSLVCILDADKEGFLRNERSLIQTIGRASRNINGKVILYADKKTDSIRRAMAVTEKRRRSQAAYNKLHKITPKTIKKKIEPSTRAIKAFKSMTKTDIAKKIIELEADMQKAAENLDFEKAVEIRNILFEMKAFTTR